MDNLKTNSVAISTQDLLDDIAQIATHVHEQQDLKLIHITLLEIRRALKLFERYRDNRKICVFGSARLPDTNPNYSLAEAFSQQIAQQGYMVITGAGGGIMSAGNKGAGILKSFGLNITLPFEQHVNPYISDDPKCIHFKYFFIRKLMFIRESDASIFFPGGYGTLDELFENVTLMQTGRCSPRPIVLLASPGSNYWEPVLSLVRNQLLGGGFIGNDDMNLIFHAADIHAAVDYVTRFYEVYHSIRYVDHTAFMRLNSPVSDATLDAINSQFSDILHDGRFVLVGPDQSHGDNPHFPDRYRLVFHFNQYSFSRLIPLIHLINASA